MISTSLLVLVVAALLFLSPLLLILFMSSDDEGGGRREALPSAYSPEANTPGPGSLPQTCLECGADNYPWREACWNCGREFDAEEADRTEALRRAFRPEES